MNRKAQGATVPTFARHAEREAAGGDTKRQSADTQQPKGDTPSREAERLTEAMHFRFVGEYFDSPSLFQVRAGAPVKDALSLAQCLLSAIQARFSDAVGGEPIRGDEAYAYELLSEMVYALYASTGAVE